MQTGVGFTDHEGLHRTGFVHMNGRVYDPRIGRFLQPDPVVAAPHHSQGHNRYAYVANAPLSAVDPSGLVPVGGYVGRTGGTADYGALYGSLMNDLWSSLLMVRVVEAGWEAFHKRIRRKELRRLAELPNPNVTAEDRTRARMTLFAYDAKESDKLEHVIDGYTLIDYKELRNGLKLVLFDNGFDAVIAAAGSDELRDRPHNFKQGFGLGSSQYDDAMATAAEWAEPYATVHFTGHSLGGGLAMAMAAETGHYSAYTVFNSAGLHPNTVVAEEFAKLNGTHYYSSGRQRAHSRNGARQADLPWARGVASDEIAVQEHRVRAVNVLLLGLAVLAVAGCAASDAEVADDEMRELLDAMEDGEKRHSRELRAWSIDYMSLARMFPDEDLRALARAAGRGRVAKIDELVASGTDVNALGRSDATALWWALRRRNAEGFARLLEHGADPNLLIGGPHYEATTIMHEAAREEDPAFLAAALAHGGDPNVRTPDDQKTPLFKANGLTRPGETTALRMLLDSGAEVDAESSYGFTVAQLRADRPDLLYELLVRGADYDRATRHGRTLLGKFARHCALADRDRKAHCAKVRAWLNARNVEVPEYEP